MVPADSATTFALSISEFARSTTLTRTEDELDLVAWEDSEREYDASPKTLTDDEAAAKHLGLPFATPTAVKLNRVVRGPMYDCCI